jgi:hypothetical protein
MFIVEGNMRTCMKLVKMFVFGPQMFVPRLQPPTPVSCTARCVDLTAPYSITSGSLNGHPAGRVEQGSDVLMALMQCLQCVQLPLCRTKRILGPSEDWLTVQSRQIIWSYSVPPSGNRTHLFSDNTHDFVTRTDTSLDRAISSTLKFSCSFQTNAEMVSRKGSRDPTCK